MSKNVRVGRKTLKKKQKYIEKNNKLLFLITLYQHKF